MIELDLEESVNSTTATPGERTSESTDEVHGWETLVATLQSQVLGQQEQLLAKDLQLESKDQQIRELHILLQQAQSALPAPKENRYLSWWRFGRR